MSGELIIQQSFINFFLALSKNHHKDHGVLRCISEISGIYYNSVLSTNCSRKNLFKLIPAITAEYGGKRFSWWAYDITQPDNLAQILMQHHFTPRQSYSGMIADLTEYTPAPVPPNIREVTTEDKLVPWKITLDLSFNFEPSSTGKYFETLKRFMLEKIHFKHYSYELDGKIIGAATLFMDKSSAGIYNIGVLPEYRNRGFASELINAILQEAQKQGYKTANLQAAAMGVSLYQRMGFKSLMTLTPYCL